MPVCPRCGKALVGNRCAACGFMTQSSGVDMTGRTFADRYHITSLLWSGTTSDVFRAHDQRTGETIWLRVLSAEASENQAESRLFLDAAMAWARLRHPHTVQVLDVGSADGRPYLVTEALEGKSLRSLFRASGRITEVRLLRIAEQVCESLCYAHQAGVLHLDLNPDNVFLCKIPGDPDFVRVLNFGLGEPVEGLSGPLRCTPAYAPPELIKGQEGDARSDLYSLGAMLYELAAGMPPFKAQSQKELLLMHLYNRPLRLGAVWPDAVSSGFDDLVISLLNKVPEDRPPDAATVLVRVRRLAARLHPVPDGFLPRTILLPGLANGPAPLAATNLGDRVSPQAIKPPVQQAPVEAGPETASPPPAPLEAPAAETGAKEPAPPSSVEQPPPMPVEPPRRRARPSLEPTEGDDGVEVIEPKPPAPAAVKAMDRARRAAGALGTGARFRHVPARHAYRTTHVPIRRHANIVIIILAMCAIVAGAIALGLWPGHEPEPTPAASPAPQPKRPVRLTQVSIHGKPAHSQLFLVRAGTETELGSPPVNLLVREDEPVQLRVAARGYEERLLTISFEEAAASPNISFELVPR